LAVRGCRNKIDEGMTSADTIICAGCRDGKTIVFVVLGDDVSSGYVDLSRRVIVFRERFQSRRPEHCRSYLEIAQLMKCPGQKTDERKK
jgi:hypothetical protein